MLPLPRAAPDAARLRYYGQIQARVLSACARPRCAWANTAPPCGSRWTPHAIDTWSTRPSGHGTRLRRALAAADGEPPPGLPARHAADPALGQRTRGLRAMSGAGRRAEAADRSATTRSGTRSRGAWAAPPTWPATRCTTPICACRARRPGRRAPSADLLVNTAVHAAIDRIRQDTACSARARSANSSSWRTRPRPGRDRPVAFGHAGMFKALGC